jgi:hypothetical protein
LPRRTGLGSIVLQAEHVRQRLNKRSIAATLLFTSCAEGFVSVVSFNKG